MEKINYKIEDIVKNTKKYFQSGEQELLDTYNYIKPFYSKELFDYVLETCSILTTVYADIETLKASLIYKLLTENLVKEKELTEKFDLQVLKLAKGASRLDKIIYSTENEYLIEYYKKIIVGMTEDVRVIMINLSSRVTLMRNIDSLKGKDKKMIAKESLEIVAPIAHHLGIYKLKSELEDLSLKVLKPDVYYDIVEKLNSTKHERDELIFKMTEEVKKILDSHDITYEMKGRSKSIYSIYNKLDKGRKFNDIYDLFALRIMVSDEAMCYLVLGLIHSKFKPIPKRFKDFIAMPKNNGYRSLHTTVFGVNNTLFEIQIRTFLMNEVAENGLAAHWSYKEHRSANNLTSTDQKLEFFKTVIDHYQDKIDTNVFEEIQDDKMHGNIYVFTPKGDVIELPSGATPIDFAYKVHTKVGEEMIGCVVNNKIVPLNYTLEDGDIVRINTSKQSSGPKLSWLKIAKLTQTKNKIKSYFGKERKEEVIKFGETTLEKYLKKKHIVSKEFLKEENVKKLLKEFKCKDIAEFYFFLGNNKFSPKSVVDVIYPKEKQLEIKKGILPKNNNEIEVSGIVNVKVNLASCCNPIPGDEVVGYITKNNGITVHRKECNNAKKDKRMIDVSFKANTQNRYLTKIRVYSSDNATHLADIISKLSSNGIVVNNVVTSIVNLKYNYLITFFIKGKKELEQVIHNLEKLNFVLEVERIMK